MRCFNLFVMQDFYAISSSLIYVLPMLACMIWLYTTFWATPSSKAPPEEPPCSALPLLLGSLGRADPAGAGRCPRSLEPRAPRSWFFCELHLPAQCGAAGSPPRADPAQGAGGARQRFPGVKQEQQWVFAGVSFQGVLQACC